MSRHHKLKIEPEFWESIRDGSKSFEVRLNDRGFRKGDYVEFETSRYGYPLCIGNDYSSPVYVINYVLNYRGIENGFVVFSFSEVKKYKEKMDAVAKTTPPAESKEGQ